MKILYGITKSNFGGAQRYVFDLAKIAKERGHDVAVLCGGNGVLVEKLGTENIRAITLNELQRDISILKEFKSLFQIIRILREEKPDIFHVNSSKMGFLGTLAGRITGIKKIIFTGHGWTFNEPRPVWQKVIIKFLVWLNILATSKTICVSEKTRRDISNLPFLKNKLTVIYNGISRNDYLISDILRQKDIDPPFVVGTVAELHRIKGLDILLKSWSRFKETPEHRGSLNILGTGEEKSNLQNMAQNMGISDSVKFVDFIIDRKSYITFLAKFDTFILPSRSEALPYTVLEAGLTGAPTIASAVGGIPEIIEDGVNGILIPPENPDALLSSLILLYENPDLRERLGSSLKKTIEEKFTLKQMVDKTFEVYS